MNTINVDSEVYAQIKKLADPAEDTPNSVLRRVFELTAHVERPTEDSWKRMTTDDPILHRLPLGTKPTKRAATDEVIPVQDFTMPIIDAIGERGGEADVDTILDAVRWKVEPIIQPRDLEPMSSGEPRWRTRAIRRKAEMIDWLLVRNAPIGFWRLTEEGMKAYRREKLSPGLEYCYGW